MQHATDDNPQLLWADGLEDVAVPSEQLHAAAATPYEAVVAAPVEFVEAPPPLAPRPPALPPRAPLDAPPPQNAAPEKASLGAKTIRAATSFAADVHKQVARTLTKAADSQAAKTLEAQAFNREVLFRVPQTFTQRSLNQSQNSRIKMITVEQFKPQLAAGLNDLASKLMPPATPSLYSAPPTNDPTGTLFFINVKQVACLIHKVKSPSLFNQEQPATTPDATTIVVLQKDIPSPINTLLRLPAAVESFDSLITRLPYSFIVLPLVTDVERRARVSGTIQDPKSKIAINSEAVISVSPLDLEWTNIVVLGSVRRSAVGSVAETANTTAGAGGNHDPNSENVNSSSSGAAPNSSPSVAGVTATLQGVAKQALETAKYKMNDVKQGHRPSTMRDNQNTFAFQVAMDFVSVLRALDADGF